MVEEHIYNEDPGRLYAVGKDLANMKLQERSGLATTAQEMERVRPVLSGEIASTPQVMHDAIVSIQQAYQKDMELLREGTHPQILAQYTAASGEGNVFNQPQKYLEFRPQGWTKSSAQPSPQSSPMPTPTGKKSIKGLTPAQIDKMSAEELSQYEF
jgi:hypothetical protein